MFPLANIVVATMVARAVGRTRYARLVGCGVIAVLAVVQVAIVGSLDNYVAGP